MHLLAQEVHERVASLADLVELRRHSAQLALSAHLTEVHGQRPQQLLGDEVDGVDVGIQKTRDVALEEVRVGDVHAAQAKLDVERRGEPLVQGRVGLDDVQPAADLGQVVGIDDRLPLVSGPLDVRVLEVPREDVLDEVIGRLEVAGFADGHPDRLVALEAHEKELVVAAAEEGREAGEDGVGVHVPVRPHHLFDDAEEVDHRLLLAIAERVVLEQEQADGEAVFEVLRGRELAYRRAEHVREGRQRRREQLVVGGRFGRREEPAASSSPRGSRTTGRRRPGR